MRQGESFEDATQLPTQAEAKRLSRRKLWRGGVVETIASLRYRDEAAYEEWLEDRDTVIIAATLLRLSDRQLARIGMSRNTVIIGVEDLKRQAERNRQIGHETLEIVDEAQDGTAPRQDDADARSIAAE